LYILLLIYLSTYQKQRELFLVFFYMFFLGYFQFGFLKGRWAGVLERVGKADIGYFGRLGLVALVVILMGLKILLTLIPSFYIVYFDILPSPSKSFLLDRF